MYRFEHVYNLSGMGKTLKSIGRVGLEGDFIRVGKLPLLCYNKGILLVEVIP